MAEGEVQKEPLLLLAIGKFDDLDNDRCLNPFFLKLFKFPSN
jgi:hypothetical protein